MQKLYDYYKSIGKSHAEAYDSAKHDAGHLLATVLDDDPRSFKVVGKDTGKLYKIV